MSDDQSVARDNMFDDHSVTRDWWATRDAVNAMRAILPACNVCGRPSGYNDLDGNPSHAICAGESSEEKIRLKVHARGGVISADAGNRDLTELVTIFERNSEGPRAKLRDQGRSAATRAHIRSTSTPAARRSPEVISRMSARDVYDVSRIQVDPFDPTASRELVDRARRAVDLADFPVAGDQAAAKDHVDKLLRRNDRLWRPDDLARRILATGSDRYRDIFARVITTAMRSGFDAPLSREDKMIVQRGLSFGAGSVGGFAVPWQLDPTIVPTSNGAVNPFRQVCRVVTTSSNEWRQATASGVVLAYSAENAVVTDTSATLGQPALIPKRVTGFVPLSNELDQDWDAAETELAQLINGAKDDLEATTFAVGSGIGTEPQGLVTGATNTVSTTGAFDVATDLYDLEDALPPRFRARAQWFGHRNQLQLIRQFVQPESAAPIVDHEVGGDTEVITYRYNEASGMIATAASANKVLVLGDPQYFVIVDHAGLDLEIASHLFSAGTSPPAGQRSLIIYYRNTSAVLDANAFRTLAIT